MTHAVTKAPTPSNDETTSEEILADQLLDTLGTEPAAGPEEAPVQGPGDG